MIPKKFRYVCVGCGETDRKTSKEHFWPRWLIQHTGTYRTSVRLNKNKRVNPLALTVPLCTRCNHEFGHELEVPASRIFDDLENGQGISGVEAELLIRWLWKFEGLGWSFSHPEGEYTERFTLRDRVLQMTAIDEVRNDLTLAIGLADVIEPEFGDAPMGLDSWNEESAIFMAGVFGRVALMVLLRKFEKDVPENFSLYRLVDRDDSLRSAKLFHPKMGFSSCVEAVRVTRLSGLQLSYAHDLDSRYREQALHEQGVTI